MPNLVSPNLLRMAPELVMADGGLADKIDLTRAQPTRGNMGEPIMAEAMERYGSDSGDAPAIR
jgi:hypothetical protein